MCDTTVIDQTLLLLGVVSCVILAFMCIVWVGIRNPDEPLLGNESINGMKARIRELEKRVRELEED